jgi:hypothetical protein
MQDDLTKCTLGEPFQLRVITPASLDSYVAGANVSTLLTESKSWYFPVYYNNALKCFLLVEKINGQWAAASIGFAPLAIKMQSLLNQWPRTKGFHHVLAIFRPNNICSQFLKREIPTLLLLYSRNPARAVCRNQLAPQKHSRLKLFPKPLTKYDPS